MKAVHRAKIVEWFLANVLTRHLDPLRMANMSRWNDDDSITWILRLAAENGREYCVPDFPAIADCRVDCSISPRSNFKRDRTLLDLE